MRNPNGKPLDPVESNSIASPPMVNLILTEKGGEPKQLGFDKDEVTIGRVAGNDVVLAKGNVSKRHCRIAVEDGRFLVADMGSTNGTYVNGKKIAEAMFLTATDKIYVGDFVIRVENAGQAFGNAATSAEAGSLSTALPRKAPPPPPPPPPPPRGNAGAGRAIAVGPASPGTALPPALPGARPTASGRVAPPPPPPARRDTAVLSVAEDSLDDAEEPPLLADLDMDEEVPAAPMPPKLSVPPIKAGISPSEDDEDLIDHPTSRREWPGSVAQAPAVADGTRLSLEQLLATEGTSAVYLSGETLQVERNGKREPGSGPEGVAALTAELRALAARGAPTPARDAQQIHVTLPGGERLVAMFPPLASALCATLRRAPSSPRSLAELVSSGSASREMREIIESCINLRRNILCTGDAGALAVLLPSLAETLPAEARVVSMGDSVAPPPISTAWVALTPKDNSAADLITTAAAMQPDYLIADIATAQAASNLVHACALGADGIVASLAGRSATDALGRLQALARNAQSSNPQTKDLVASAFDVVILAAIVPSGDLRLIEIGEPRLDPDGRLWAEPLVTWKPENGGKFQASGATSRLAATLAARGVPVPGGLKK